MWRTFDRIASLLLLRCCCCCCCVVVVVRSSGSWLCVRVVRFSSKMMVTLKLNGQTHKLRRGWILWTFCNLPSLLCLNVNKRGFKPKFWFDTIKWQSVELVQNDTHKLCFRGLDGTLVIITIFCHFSPLLKLVVFLKAARLVATNWLGLKIKLSFKLNLPKSLIYSQLILHIWIYLIHFFAISCLINCKKIEDKGCFNGRFYLKNLLSHYYVINKTLMLFTILKSGFYQTILERVK